MRREGAREGNSGGESRCDGPGVMCFVGDSTALEPRPWNQGGRAQVSSSPRSFRPRIPQSSRLWSTADGRTQRVRQRTTARPPERAGRDEPQERQRTQRVRRAGGRSNRRGGEKPRGRIVPGEANPGDADPSADVAEGARNPRRGNPVRKEREGHPSPNPERAAKPAEVAGGSSDPSDGRTAEHLEVVKTTRRGR
jgi:hypothetical protein